MKNISLLIIVLLIVSAGIVHAQTNKGNTIVGISTTLNLVSNSSELMNLGFSTVKYKSDADGYQEPDADKMTNINFMPKIGYFLVDNFAVGVDFSLALSIEKDGTDNDKNTQTIISAGPFLRYYIPTSKVSPYFEVSSSFGSSKYKYISDTWDNSESKSGIMSFGGGIGIAAPLGNRVSMDVLAGYNSLTIKDKENNTDNDRIVVGTFGVNLGFTVILGSN